MRHPATQTVEPLTLTSDSPVPQRGKSSFLFQIGRRVLFTRLRQLAHGTLTLVEGQSQASFGAASEASDLHVTVTIHDPRAYSGIAFGGSIGAAEAYMDGQWTCDDLTALIRILVLNRNTLDKPNTMCHRDLRHCKMK